MIRFVNVTVHRNELHHQPVSVPQWELPLLQALYAGRGLVVTGHKDVEREAPEPEAEYDRLGRKYREFRDENGDYTGQSVVAEVYGKHGIGLQRLSEEIERAVVESEAPEIEAAGKKGRGKGKGKGGGYADDASGDGGGSAGVDGEAGAGAAVA